MKQHSRELTVDEVRSLFLHAVWSNIEYWEKEKRAPTSREKLEGLAHSLLVMLDGDTMRLPRFDVVPHPHPDDRAYSIKNNEPYFPAPSLDQSISGSLHELFYGHQPGKGQEAGTLTQEANAAAEALAKHREDALRSPPKDRS